MIQVYAVLARAPRKKPAKGASGEPLRFVKVGPLVAAAGTLDAAPELSKDALVKRDAFVRELAAATDAILPARWGSLLRDEEELAEELNRRAPALVAALESVKGCEQMSIHAAVHVALRAHRAAGSGPKKGADYLKQRAREIADEEQAPELERLLHAVKDLVRGERVHRRGTLLGVSHLIERGRADEYRKLAETVKMDLAWRVSGPDPPYAFAPELA